MVKWDGKERRTEHIDGHDGRREGDWHCPDHHEIQRNTKEHRTIVCGKIKTVKEDTEKDLAALKSYHDKDVEDLKLGINGDLRGMLRFVSVLMTIAVLVIGGQALWLRSDISDVGSKIQRLNQRVTESVDSRITTDLEQTRLIENIAGEIKMVSYRMGVLEEAHKVVK
jgi:hypothetical protein